MTGPKHIQSFQFPLAVLTLGEGIAKCCSFWIYFQDGIVSPEDIDTAMSQGLGPRYSFMGIFETMHLNATGMQDYCERYGDNILTVCRTQEPPRPLSGTTLETVRQAMERRVPLDKLDERRKWRDSRLAALAIHKMNVQKSEDEQKST